MKCKKGRKEDSLFQQARINWTNIIRVLKEKVSDAFFSCRNVDAVMH